MVPGNGHLFVAVEVPVRRESHAVSDEESLAGALADQSGPLEIALSADFTAKGTHRVTGDVLLDLKGHNITYSRAGAGLNLFEVAPGGSLAIRDTEPSGDVEAVEYEVMLSEAKEDGTTSEEVERRSVQVPRSGRIVLGRGGDVPTAWDDFRDGPGDFHDACIVRVDGGRFVLEGGALDCGKQWYSHGVQLVNDGTFEMSGGAVMNASGSNSGSITSGGGVSVLSGTMLMSGGVVANNYNYMCGGGIYIRDGAVDISGGVVTGNHASCGGGIGGWHGGGSIVLRGDAVVAGNRSDFYYGGGIVSRCESTTLSDGTVVPAGEYGLSIRDGAMLTMNMAGSWGGGAMMIGDVEMSGGYVTGNKGGQDNEGYECGGIRMVGGHVFTLSGGTIAGNLSSGGGGGIHVDGGKLLMSGGIVSNNVAELAEGGGIRVTAGSLEITAGHITGNRTLTPKDWGGGGIFVNDRSTATIMNLLVTGNTAEGLGGGVAGCSTGQIAVSATDGMACFGNTANGAPDHGAEGSYKWQDKAALNNPDFVYYGADDYFCAHSSYVMDGMLGGGSARWHGSQDDGTGYRGSGAGDGSISVVKLAIPEGGAAASKYLMGLTASPDGKAMEDGRQTARTFITGNYSNTHGGGIMCNGVLQVGAPIKEARGVSSVPVEAEKVLLDVGGEPVPLEGGEFSFKLAAAGDCEVKQGRPVLKDGCSALEAANDANGKVLFTIDGLDETGTYEYYLWEEPGGELDVAYDRTVYKIAVRTREVSQVKWDVGNGIKIDVTSYGVEDMSMEKLGSSGASETVGEAVFTNRVVDGGTGFELPGTGGSGTAGYLVLGVACAMAGAGMLLARRRRRAAR